ncbi:MAG: cupin domain-containing protein [Patescibacteria group bacterium]|nr:cupin domain-containing protein [Patescibacteria group bacterium]
MNKNIRQLIEYPQDGILSKIILQDEHFNITLFCMAKGTAISNHTSTKPGFVTVLEGQGTFNLQGKNILMEPQIFIAFDKNAIHSLKAEKNTSFLLTLANK